MERDSRKLIKLLKQAGWYEAGRQATGSHRQFRHPGRKGRVTVPHTVPHPRKDIKIGTLMSIYRQAGWR